MAKTRQQLNVVTGKETRRSTRRIISRKSLIDEEETEESESSSYQTSQRPRQNEEGNRILQIVDTIYTCGSNDQSSNPFDVKDDSRGYPADSLTSSNHVAHHRLVEPHHRTRSFQQQLNGYQNGHIHGRVGQLTDSTVRRSTRQRKFIHDNLNQSWLLATGVSDFAKLYADKHLVVEDADSSNPVKDEDDSREKNSNFECLDESSQDFDDMYSRVKRVRRKTKFFKNSSRDLGHMADTEDTDNNVSMGEDDDEATDIEEGSEVSRVEAVGRLVQNGLSTRHTKYSLRPKKPITDRFQCPIEPSKPKRSAAERLFHTPHRRTRAERNFSSRSPYLTRKRRAAHNSSTTTSSSSDDERSFEKRKMRSMAKARNRCLPLNIMADDPTKGFLRDRINKIGSSLADVDPMSLDKTVKFDKVGGLREHIEALKEMILFPLMYPEVFEKFHIDPPRGVLFYGPPGTGKTLVARALANECSQGTKRVSFFMRKGADCLSKWVGESERQLRLLFDQAYNMRPSIIFFDEIDGLAPVRSTRQDQIHSSIVSTILALMDGLDNRGEIVVIGATNRVDAIDPALRRPGRFDREFHFPLPSLEDRKTILRIHTQAWDPPVTQPLLTELSIKTVGYCGADLKSLCAESALIALKRCFPQIYQSSQKLLLNTTSIQILREDFERAMAKIIPAGHRANPSPARPLGVYTRPLLQRSLLKIIGALRFLFPIGLKHSSYELSFDSSCVVSSTVVSSLVDEDSYPDGLLEANQSFGWMPNHRPRLLLAGQRDQGQTTHLAPSVLHCLEHLPMHRLELPNLYSVTCRSPEEACAQIFREALQKVPCILYLPHIGQWWETVSDTVRVTLSTLLHDINPSMPVLFLATSDSPFASLPLQVKELFQGRHELMETSDPTDVDRRAFFSNILKQVLIPPKKLKKAALRPLPLAPPPEPRKMTEEELEKVRQKEESSLRELRLFLRDIVNKLARDRRFVIFNKPVDNQEVPDYLEVISTPMDLETIMSKIDLHQYETVNHFLTDINLICHNALEYNPDRDPADKLIRHRACLFKDTAHAMIDNQLDEEFAQICEEINGARKFRGESPSKYAPKNYHVFPSRRTEDNRTDEVQKPSGKENDGVSAAKRFSRRLRSLDVGISDEAGQATNAEVVEEEVKPVEYKLIRKKLRSPWFGSKKTVVVRRPLLPSKSRVSSEQTARNNAKQDSRRTECEEEIEPEKRVQETQEDDARDERLFSSSSTIVIEPETECAVGRGEEEEETDEEDRRVLVNMVKLSSLEETFVATTAKFSVEMLERLQVTLQQSLIKHCRQINKDLLLEEMETEVDSFVRHVKRSL